MSLNRRVLMLAAIALAGLPAAGGCTDAGHDVPAPDPTTAARQLLDADRIGDRSGNPSCEIAVERVDHLVWRQAVDARDTTGLPLTQGATVRADKDRDVRASDNQQRWVVTVTVGGRTTTYGAVRVVVRRAFATSCAREVYRLHSVLRMYRDWVRDDQYLERFDAGEVVAVSGTTTIDGELWRYVHTLAGDAYAVPAEHLRRAATRL